MAVVPVRRMHKSVSAGLPAKSEGFVSIMVHTATTNGASHLQASQANCLPYAHGTDAAPILRRCA